MSTTNLILSGCAALGLISGNMTDSSPVAMGGWASGGGQILRDSSNPWFLENTTSVDYCIDIDEQNFGLSSTEASKEVAAAIADWVKLFNLSEDDYYAAGELEPYGQLRVGTQTFNQHDCSENIDFDLRFQMGRLTASQSLTFQNPKDFVGIALRTDYQKENLRGKGFIYLAPVAGPLVPDIDIHPQAWAIYDSLVLKMVLRHEIGHIFGITHEIDTIMDQQLPEFLVREKLLQQLSRDSQRNLINKRNIFRLLGYNGDLEVEGCGAYNPIFSRDLFRKTYRPDDCGKVSLKGQTVNISYRPDGNRPYELVATGSLGKKNYNSTPITSVYLSKEQKVFTKLPPELENIPLLFGEDKRERQRFSGGLKILATDEILPLQIDLSNDLATAMVFKDGEFINDAFFLD